MNPGPVGETVQNDPRSATRLKLMARIAGLLTILASLAAMWAITLGSGIPFDPFNLFAFLLPVAYLAPGVVLLLRRHWHIVGWMLCLFGLGTSFAFSEVPAVLGPWRVFFQDLAEGSPFWFPMVVLLVLFPDGLSAQTPRQARFGRWVLILGGVPVILDILMTEFTIGTNIVPHPLGIGIVPPLAAESAFLLELAALVLALGGLIWRYRSAASVARRQYRWVLSAIVLLIVALAFGIAGSELSENEDGIFWVPILFAYLLVPISFMVAILRYRLYEIDRLVSRTVTYSVVVALLVGLYAVLVGLVSQTFTIDNNVAVAAATLASAAVFSPLRRRVQHVVDRRFNRTRFDAQIELEAFASRLREVTELDVVKADMQAVVGRTLQPAALSLWVRGET